MQNVLNWVLANWQWLLSSVISLISFIVLLCKRKIKIQDVMTCTLEILPKLISQAESQFGAGKGEDKFKYVFTEALKLTAVNAGIDLTSCMDKYGLLIEQAIESILATPNKKED